MPFSEDQLKILNADYAATLRKPVRRFVCPITLRDDPGALLCDGHILNKSIKTAARKTIVQREDVDNYFGKTIEPELVAYLNIPIATPKELIARGRDLTVSMSNGEKVPAFFANKNSRPKLPRISLLGKDGETIVSPYLRTDYIEPKLHKDIQVEWLMAFTDSALLGSMLKSAYLAAFHILGYLYVHMDAGDHLRKALAGFFNDKATKEQAVNYFGNFKGAVSFFQTDVPEDHKNCINDGLLWFHSRTDGPVDHRLFAITCLFRINGRMITVMIPYCTYPEDFKESIAYYQAALADRTVQQVVNYGFRVGEALHVHPEPLKLQYR